LGQTPDLFATGRPAIGVFLTGLNARLEFWSATKMSGSTAQRNLVAREVRPIFGAT
jgi:hypothetical protein